MRPFKHPDIDAVSLEHLLHALSDPVRMDIVRRLADEGEASCSALDGGRPNSSITSGCCARLVWCGRAMTASCT